MEPAGAGARDEEDLVDGGIGDVDGLDDVGADELRSDVDLLLRVWQNEKCAPEILPYEATLVERVREQIQLMEENIEAFATEIKDDLMLSLYRMDVNRTLFLLRSYLRARLHKIERFPIHIVDNPELWDRLSEHEQEYTNKYCEILAKHFEKTVLIRLPDQYGSMLKQTSLASEENDMITQPQLNTFVFCRSRGAIGSFQLDDKGDEAVDLMTDDLYILRYKPVRKLLVTDKIELI
ncbi:GINS complex subunit 4 [Marchantia polymorpha subsp. ruderalis]|uniref:DNA replication complex GINS protein SLD5 n=2 Tax=Marchantia polymorpha TaxID=3197 RepID=A0AAF6AK71_MARPO|nr:hypothetical protein MARPO_0029s0136 [Marchantia polymorpha]BBM96841.1 hypothetical protein Mp_1g01100 [Marchantia polymorpha subsp. ruderalis]|eukprot:PTQ42642.1 hypothetical protein MARPO_0029s0136 [Marchantia polymorpha]